MRAKINGTFIGYVDVIDESEGLAYVTLESVSGEVLEIGLESHLIAIQGIREQQHFLCEIDQDDQKSLIEVSPLPILNVSDFEAQAIAKEMQAAFPDDGTGEVRY